MTAWYKVRIILSTLGFIEGVVIAVLGLGAMVNIPVILTIAMIPVVALLSGAGLLLVIGTQVINPFRARKWVLPNWDSNILDFRQPLNFFHAGALTVVAAGAGNVIGSVFGGIAYVAEGAVLLAGGMGILWGIKTCSKLYKDKFSLDVEKMAVEEAVPAKNRVRKILLGFIGGAILFSGLMLIILSSVFVTKTKKFVANAVEADGVIVDFDEKFVNGNRTYKPVYEFVDEMGETHRGKASWSSSHPKYKEGDTVALLYNPEDKDDSRINSFASTWLMLMVMGGMGIVSTLIGSVILLCAFLKGKSGALTIKRAT